jgi:hypothetical protein
MRQSTLWNVFTVTPPVTGYTAGQCLNDNVLGTYICTQASGMALQHAQELKAKGIKIYTIGLGSSSEIDPAYLRSLSSGDGFTYIAPTSADLEAVFNKIAKDIKLRLVY